MEGAGLSPSVSAPSPQPDGAISPPVQQSSWSKKLPGLPILEQNKPVFDLDNGVARVSIPDDIVDEASPLWERFVVGYFMGDAPYIGKIHATVNRIWTSSSNSSRIDVQFLSPTSVLFRIDSAATRARVLKRRYWHISDIPVVVSEWRPETANERPELSAMPLWVDLSGVPGHMFSQKGLRYLGDITGNFVRLHPNTERCTRLDMARVLVEVDLTKPMTEKICFQDRQGVEVTVSVSYPWLPPRCSGCNKWGHKEAICILNKPKTILSKQEGTVIQNGVKGQHETLDANVSCDSGSRLTAVQNLMTELNELTVLPAVTEGSLECPEMETQKSLPESTAGHFTENQVHDPTTSHEGSLLEEKWETVDRSGRISPQCVHVQPPTSSPSHFQILADIPEDGEIVEAETNGLVDTVSEGTGTEAVLIVNEDASVRFARDKTLSRHSGKKSKKPILNRKVLLQVGLQSNAKKASSRKL